MHFHDRDGFGPRGGPGFDRADQMLSGLPPEHAELYGAVMRLIHQQGRCMARLIAHRGVHFRQVGCLQYLKENSGANQTELAARMHIEPATMSSMLQRMERAGLVRRRRGEEDAREVLVSITDEGGGVLRVAEKTMRDFLTDTLKPFSPEECATFTALVDKLVRSQQEALEIQGAEQDRPKPTDRREEEH